jgi:hypothetical protein
MKGNVDVDPADVLLLLAAKWPAPIKLSSFVPAAVTTPSSAAVKASRLTA